MCFLVSSIVLVAAGSVGLRSPAQIPTPSLNNGVPPEDLASLLRRVPVHPDDPTLMPAIIERLQNAPLAEVKANVPTLVDLAESGSEAVRTAGLLALVNVGFCNQGSQSIPAMSASAVPDLAQDPAATELLIPYIPELLGLLSRGSAMDRTQAFSVVEEISRLKPVPPALVSGLLRLLAARQSTLASTDGPALGPKLLWVLLPSAATFYTDPATHITVAWDSQEAQDAMLQFLNRDDQTPDTLAESIRALAFALPQNPRVNATLVKLLDNECPQVQLALVQQLPKISLPPDAFFTGKQRVGVLVDDPATTAEVRAAAARMLPCWTNDLRHEMCPMPEPAQEPGN